jgi:hypothetical protein
MNNYKANNLSGTPGFREIFSRHVAVPMMFCVGAYGFLQSLDVA